MMALQFAQSRSHCLQNGTVIKTRHKPKPWLKRKGYFVNDLISPLVTIYSGLSERNSILFYVAAKGSISVQIK